LKESGLLRNVLRRTFYVLVCLYAAGTIFGGIYLGWIALHPGRRPLNAQYEQLAAADARTENAELRDVEITARDGVTLRAWFIQPAQPNGGTVILLHGVSDNRLGVYGYGRWLVANHYSVLLPDSRAHGVSGGEIATYGLLETDIHRWASWLVQNAHPSCIFGLGESMGAAQLLQSLPAEPRFCAAVAESPFSSFREVAYARFGRPFHTGPWLGKTFFRPTIAAGFLYVRLRYGMNMEDASPEHAVETTHIPVLLIHGLDDINIPPYHSARILAHNPTNSVLWNVPGAVHTGAHQTAPQEFEHKVLSWFPVRGF